MIQYDEDTHCPKLLFCGHTFCTKCINNIFRSDHLKCPLCNREFPVASVDDLPKNFALLDLIQSNSVQVETANVSNPNGNEAQQRVPSQQMHGGVMDQVLCMILILYRIQEDVAQQILLYWTIALQDRVPSNHTHPSTLWSMVHMILDMMTAH